MGSSVADITLSTGHVETSQGRAVFVKWRCSCSGNRFVCVSVCVSVCVCVRECVSVRVFVGVDGGLYWVSG